MTALEDINTKIDGLAAEVAQANGKTDALLAGFSDVKAALAALQKQFDSAVPITADDVAVITAKIDAITGAVKSEEAKEDAALAAPTATATAADSAPAA